MTVHRFGTLLECIPTQLAVGFVITTGGKIEQDGGTTGTDLAGVVDENGRKIGGVVEQNCEAGAVEHCPGSARGGVTRFPPRCL